MGVLPGVPCGADRCGVVVSCVSGGRALSRHALWKRRRFWDLAALAGLLFSVGGVSLRVVQPLVLPVKRIPVPAVSLGALEGHVRFLTGCSPRDYRTPDNLDRCANYIHAALESSGGRCGELAYAALGGKARVVLARFGPEGPVTVVVGAHYDSCGNTPGADDNASGTAGLLELGRLLGENPPAACVELAAYPHEEIFGTPQMGSAHHARSLREAGAPVRVMICLEMIGCFGDLPGSQRYPLRILRPFYPSAGDFITLVGRSAERSVLRTMKRAMAGASDLPVRSVCAPFPIPGLDLSDHYPFWKVGFIAIMVTDTGFYRNERYHTGEDTPDTLDYRRMAEVVRGVYAGVLALASEPTGPPVAKTGG